MPSQRLGNPTSVCSPACPLSTPPSAPAAPRVTELNTLLIYFILFYFIIIHPPEKRHLRYLWLITRSQPSLWLIFFDRNVLIRSLQMAWKDAPPQRRGKVEERGGKKKFACFLTLARAFICAAFPEYGSKLERACAHATERDAERIYNYNARLIKEREYNRFQMNLCD